MSGFSYTKHSQDIVNCEECGENHDNVTVTVQRPPGIAGFRCPKTGKFTAV